MQFTCNLCALLNINDSFFEKSMEHEHNNLLENISEENSFTSGLKEWNMFQIFSCHLISICF